MIFAGVDPAHLQMLQRTGFTQRLGPENIVVATPRIFDALDEAVRRGEAWLAEHGS